MLREDGGDSFAEALVVCRGQVELAGQQHALGIDAGLDDPFTVAMAETTSNEAVLNGLGRSAVVEQSSREGSKVVDDDGQLRQGQADGAAVGLVFEAAL